MHVRWFGCLLAVLFTLSFTSSSHANSNAADTWRGYGDAGYIGTSKSFKKAVSASGYGQKKAAKASGTKYAALKYGLNDASPSQPKKKVTGYNGGGVRWVASAGCLNGSLRSLVASVAANYGAVTVSSTCRSRGHNAKVGGAKRSQHLTGDAVDFRVHGNWRSAAAFIRSNAGGFKHYGGGLFHADTGPRRSW